MQPIQNKLSTVHCTNFGCEISNGPIFWADLSNSNSHLHRRIYSIVTQDNPVDLYLLKMKILKYVEEFYCVQKQSHYKSTQFSRKVHLSTLPYKLFDSGARCEYQSIICSKLFVNLRTCGSLCQFLTKSSGRCFILHLFREKKKNVFIKVKIDVGNYQNQ